MRMLSANFWLALALWLVVFYHAQALEPSLHNKKPVDGLNDETHCSWDCTVLDSDFWKEMKTKIAKKKVVRFVFKYEKRVTEKCFSQTLRSSSENITEVWHVWWENKQLSVFTTASENVINLLNCLVSVKPHEEILTTCTLTPVSRTATEPTYYNGSSPKLFRSQLADLGLKLDSVDCNTQATDSLQPCMKITKSAENSQGILKCGGWPADVFVSLLIVFIDVFCYYCPAFLCLFSPTVVTENSVRQIVLDGASPVSLRSLVGNYLFSKEVNIWHRLRVFILRGVVLPLPFLVPAIFAEYLQQRIEILTSYHFGVSSHLLQPWMIVYYVCYYILSFYVSFFPPPKQKRPCLICRQVKSKTFACQENLPKAMINHLRIQPQIIVHCWGMFIKSLKNYFKKCFLLLPSVFEVSAKSFLRLFLFIVLLSVSPAIIIILLILRLLVGLRAILFTFPVTILIGITFKFKTDFRNRRLRRFSKFVGVSVVLPFVLGTLCLLMFASIGILVTFLSVFVLVLSEESLPFVACFGLALYYLLSSYSSFTTKYQDLGLAIFKHYKSYKKSRHSEVTDVAINTDSQIAADNKDGELKIPQKLFHMACEQLMPIRESFCLLILKVTIIVSFVFLVLLLTILLNASATPVMRALIAFLTGSFPKIVAIYMGGSREKEIEAMIAEEKIPEIVQKYMEETSTANQQQVNVNSGSDVNV